MIVSVVDDKAWHRQILTSHAQQTEVPLQEKDGEMNDFYSLVFRSLSR